MNFTDVVLRLALALVGGAVIGWEREWRNKPAGLKTHILVTVGSAAFVLAALEFFNSLHDDASRSGADMMKVIGGIVGGVGFLGAGSIMRTGGNVQGLTTAATIWLAAAIGVATGLGNVTLAGCCVVIALVTLVVFDLFERHFFPANNDKPPNATIDASNPEGRDKLSRLE
jgi:putative Mg2+ transporter-C (MgtC) family protein